MGIQREFLKFIDDRCEESHLTHMTHPEVNNCFLNCLNFVIDSESDRIDEPEDSGGHTGISLDDITNFGDIAGF